MTWNSVPSRSRVIPFLRSLVDTLMDDRPSEDDELLRRPRDHAAAILLNDDHVLDAHAAELGHVDAGLHGDHRPHRKHVVGGGPERRSLMDLQADPVAQTVAEALPVAGVLDHGSRRVVGDLARETGPAGTPPPPPPTSH